MGQSTIRAGTTIYHEVGGYTTEFWEGVPTETAGENTTQGRIDSKSIRIAAAGDSAGGDKVLLWDGTAAGAIRDFSLIAANILTADAAMQYYWMVDTPTTDPTDLSASGTHPKVIPDSGERKAVTVWTNTRVYMSNTDATTMGLSGGLPNLLSGTHVSYKRYKLWCRNLGAAAVDMQFAVMD